MKKKYIIFFSFFMLLSNIVSQSFGDTLVDNRFALVIGNADYKNSRLRWPVIEAKKVFDSLQDMNFKCVYIENASRELMHKSVNELGVNLKKGGVGLFYFSGHGLQYKDKNYLLPIGPNITTDKELEFEALDVDRIVYEMDTNTNAVKIIILDACREYPILRRSKSHSNMIGLTRNIDIPSGTFIAYATSPDSVAEDGVYTKHLLKNINRIGVPIEAVFKNIRRDVIAETKRAQIPWDSSSLTVDFCFIPDKTQIASTKKEKIIPSIVINPTESGTDTFAIDSIYYKEYLKNYIDEYVSPYKIEVNKMTLNYYENKEMIIGGLGCLGCLFVLPTFTSDYYKYSVNFNLIGEITFEGKRFIINEEYSEDNNYNLWRYSADERKMVCQRALDQIMEKFDNNLKGKTRHQ